MLIAIVQIVVLLSKSIKMRKLLFVNIVRLLSQLFQEHQVKLKKAKQNCQRQQNIDFPVHFRKDQRHENAQRYKHQKIPHKHFDHPWAKGHFPGKNTPDGWHEIVFPEKQMSHASAGIAVTQKKPDTAPKIQRDKNQRC